MPSIDPDAIYPPYWDLSDKGLGWAGMTLGDLFTGRWTRARRREHRLRWRQEQRRG